MQTLIFFPFFVFVFLSYVCVSPCLKRSTLYGLSIGWCLVFYTHSFQYIYLNSYIYIYIYIIYIYFLCVWVSLYACKWIIVFTNDMECNGVDIYMCVPVNCYVNYVKSVMNWKLLWWFSLDCVPIVALLGCNLDFVIFIEQLWSCQYIPCEGNFNTLSVCAGYVPNMLNHWWILGQSLFTLIY